MAAVRVFVKKQKRLDHLSFKQRRMAQLGTVATSSVINRARKARNTLDAPSKPLKQRYRIKKIRLIHRDRRDLTLTGDMLRNLQVRTVTENKATSSFSTLKNRQKARANEAIEPWLGYSPSNRKAVAKAGQLMLEEDAPRMVIERILNG